MARMLMREGEPSLYEESIARRGQHVLWYSSNACICLSDHGRVDPNCLKCFGQGFKYYPITSARHIIWGVTTGTAVNNIPNKYKIKSINKVLLNRNDLVSVLSFTDNSFTLSSVPKKGVKWTLDYENSFETIYDGPCEYSGNGIIYVPIQIENVNGVFPGVLTEVSEIRNVTQSTIIPVNSYWRNQILINAAMVDINDTIEVSCKYISSLIFLLSGINPKQRLSDQLIAQQAIAQMSFPGTYHVGRGDIIACLTAETKDSVIGINNGAVYKLPYFKIAQILKIEDRYGEITDYTLVRENEIVWGDRIPSRFAITFTYHPAFSVLDELPNLRYSEDKIYPKKVFIKKFDSFNYAGKVLKIYDPNTDDLGLIESPVSIEEQGGLI